MEVEGMLRHFISQLHNQDYLDSRPQLLLHFPHSRHHNNHNGCFDGGSVDDYYTLIMAKERSESLEPSKPKRLRKERTRAEKSKSKRKAESESERAMEMEQEVWKDFPEDLLEMVIARLPVAAFFRSRSVCHKWNSLLASRSFSARCSEITNHKPWLYTATTAGDNAMYDPSLKKWHPHQLPFASEETCLTPAASAGGLVCFHESHERFFVCNPLTGAFRELPAPQKKGWRCGAGMGMWVAENGEYEIVWTGVEGEYEVYDSRDGTWGVGGVGVRAWGQGVSTEEEGGLYFMRVEGGAGMKEYRTRGRGWKEYLVPSPAPGVRDKRLVGLGKGRLGMVGLLTKNAATCVCVWELQRMTLLWKEVDRMPNVWCLDLYGKHVRMFCVVNSLGLLVLSLVSTHATRLVAYDVATRHWFKVAPPPHARTHYITGATAFHPSLTAVP